GGNRDRGIDPRLGAVGMFALRRSVSTAVAPSLAPPDRPAQSPPLARAASHRFAPWVRLGSGLARRQSATPAGVPAAGACPARERWWIGSPSPAGAIRAACPRPCRRRPTRRLQAGRRRRPP